MINDQKRAEFDQHVAAVVEFLPLLWWRMYEELRKHGFDERQSLSLLRTYVASQCQTAKE